MSKLFILSVITIAFSAFSCGTSMKNIECSHYYDSNHNIRIFTKVDSPAVYPKGLMFLLQDFNKSIKLIPDEELQFTYVFEIILEDNGNIFDVGILNKKENEQTMYEKQAISLLYNYTPWNPAKCGENNVYYKFNFPLRINFDQY
jgi:hypothetical protein